MWYVDKRVSDEIRTNFLFTETTKARALEQFSHYFYSAVWKILCGIFILFYFLYMGIFEIRLSLTFLIIFIDFNKSFDLYKRNFLI